MGAPPVSSLYHRMSVTKSSSEPTLVMLHGMAVAPPTTTVCESVDARPLPVELVAPARKNQKDANACRRELSHFRDDHRKCCTKKTSQTSQRGDMLIAHCMALTA